MIIDPQVDPRIVYPVLIALALLFLILRWRQGDGHFQLATLVLIGVVIIVFLLSRTALF